MREKIRCNTSFISNGRTKQNMAFVPTEQNEVLIREGDRMIDDVLFFFENSFVIFLCTNFVDLC